VSKRLRRRSRQFVGGGRHYRGVTKPYEGIVRGSGSPREEDRLRCPR
jgi:hypothetical protein